MGESPMMSYVHAHACALMCLCVCAHVCGVAPTHSHPHPIAYPPTRGSLESVKFEYFNSVWKFWIFGDSFTHGWVYGWLGGWVGQWVGSCQTSKNWVNCDLIEIRKFCLYIYDCGDTPPICNLKILVRKILKYLSSCDVLLHMGFLLMSCINLDFQIINANTYFALTLLFIPK